MAPNVTAQREGWITEHPEQQDIYSTYLYYGRHLMLTYSDSKACIYLRFTFSYYVNGLSSFITNVS